MVRFRTLAARISKGFQPTVPPRSLSDDQLYAFGPFIVDPVRGQLRRGTAVVPLTPKAFRILVKLVQARGEVVSREILLHDLWPHVIVEENTLAKHVSTLRKALRATAEDPDYIVTISGRGYRLATPIVEVPIVEVPLVEPAAATSDAPPPQPLGEPIAPPSAAGYSLSLFSVFAIALLAAVTALNVKARNPPPASAPQSNLWQLTYGVGLQQQPTWSPDGRWIAYSDDVNGHADIWVQPIDDGDPIRITDDAACDAQPAWSPDGTQLAFQSEREGGGLFVVPALGGTPRRISSFGCCPQWSPDGTELLFYNEFPRSDDEAPAPYVVSVATGATRQVLIEALNGLILPRFAWHPDGRRVSMWAREASTSRWHFLTVPIDGGPAVESVATDEVERRLVAAKLHFTAFTWAPSGNALYLAGNARGVTDLWRITVNPTTLAWLDGPDRLTTGIGADAGLSLSADGSRIAFTARRERTRVWELPLDAKGRIARAAASPLTPQGITPAHVDVSPTGNSLVYQTTRAGYEELWVQRLTDGTQQLVAGGHDGQMLRVPRWSRDGKQLASHRGGSSIVVRDDVANREWPLTGAGTRMLLPSDWSRDGRDMLVTCAQADPRTIGVCRLSLGDAPTAERNMHALAVRDGSTLWQSRFSPDDRWITFVAFKGNDARASTIYVMPASGGEWIAVTDGRSFEDKPRWSADGRTVYFVSNRSGLLNVWGHRFDPAAGKLVGKPFRVTKLDSPELTLLPNTEALELSVTRDKMFLPLTEISGQVWILENVR